VNTYELLRCYQQKNSNRSRPCPRNIVNIKEIRVYRTKDQSSLLFSRERGNWYSSLRSTFFYGFWPKKQIVHNYYYCCLLVHDIAFSVRLLTYYNITKIMIIRYKSITRVNWKKSKNKINWLIRLIFTGLNK